MEWKDDIPAEPVPRLAYPGEGDPRSMGMDGDEYAEWADGRGAAKSAARAKAKARWQVERALAERARVAKNLETDPRHIADMHALNKLADEWIADPHT